MCPRRVCKRLPLVLAAVLLLAGSAAAGAPEWLLAAARQPVPSYPADSETNAVVLLDEKDITVRDNGEIVTLHRLAYKVLNAKGRSVAQVSLPFDPETKLSNVRAWSLPADGSKEYELKEKDMAEIAFSESFYDEERRKVFEIPAADPGNVVGYEYEQKQRPYVLQDQFWFQHSYPVLDARLSLSLPPGWESNARFVNYAEQPAVVQGSTRLWEMRNIPAIESEPDMPPYDALESRVLLDYFPSRDELKARAHGTWPRVGEWFQSLTSGRAAATPEIQQKVSELAAGAPDPISRVRRIAEFVQHDVRYVAIEIGIGGYQPHPASSVFASRYGDCKDKATLLIAMLQAAGVNAYYVVLNSDRGVVLPDYPTAATFDHVIVAIALPAGTPRDGLLARFDSKALGPLLAFDPTSELTPFGELPSAEQGGYALLLAGDGGELVQLPLLPSTSNRLDRTAKLVLSPDGTLSGSVEELRTGYLAVSSRSDLRGSTELERKQHLESFLNGFLTGVDLKMSEVQNLNRPSEPLMLRYSFDAPSYVKHAGNLLLLRPRVLGQKWEDSLESSKERNYPMVFPGPTVQTDTYEIKLPAGIAVDELPDPVKLDCGYLSYQTDLEVKGSVLLYRRTYTVNKVLVPTQDLPQVKKFFRQVLAEEQSSAVLKRAALQ